MPSLQEALTAARARLGHLVREREVLRCSVALRPGTEPAGVESARREVLAWAQRRAGQRLPMTAWDGESFELPLGGRGVAALSLRSEEGIVWAFRGDDPDKSVPGRTWTTEVVIGSHGQGAGLLAVRLLASSAEEDLDVLVHAPGFLRQIAANVGLFADGRALAETAARVETEADVASLCELLEKPDRRLPALVLAGDEREADPDSPTLDADRLARALLGLAHCVVLPSRHSYALSDEFGRLRSVYHGAVRLYWPGFDAAASPYEHPLFLKERFLAEPEAVERRIRALVATDSLRRRRLGDEVPSFLSVRDALREAEREALRQRGASVEERLRSAEERIVELEQQLRAAREAAEFQELLRLEAEEQHKREKAEFEQRLAEAQRRAGAAAAEPELPARWEEFADWCDEHLGGRVILAAPLRKRLKKALFLDVALAARCLLWLAQQCLPRRRDGGGPVDGPLPGEPGIHNTPCGEDAFDFDHAGHRLTADWHIKTGGNTREPEHCLRIYYAYDPVQEAIVVADMPAHRRTGAS
jgi:hypothetical protein